jgi:hypothetical protein
MSEHDLPNSDSGEEILRGLPGWMPTEPGSGNYNLLDAVGQSIDDLNDDIDALDKATTIQDAENVEQLEALASLVDLPRELNEEKEKYRARLIAKYQRLTNEASVEEIVKNSATILGVEKEKIGARKISHGSIEIKVPGESLDKHSLGNSDFSEIVSKMVAAGFSSSSVRRGTFTYITPTEYGNSNFESSRGYDGLDTDDNPKDTGGTYAGLIN